MRFFVPLLVVLLAVVPACGPAELNDVGQAPTPDTPTAAPSPSPEATTPTATAKPTAEPTPTEEPTEEPEPTPTEETAAATAAPSPGTTPDGIAIRPELEGTLAFVRDGDIHAYQPQTGEVSVLIENGRDMQFSRDGSQIAFVRDDGLYLAAADGSDIRQLVAQSNLEAPRWSDDGSRLVFERRIDPSILAAGEIWTVELPDGEPVQVASGNDPAWAPDNQRIAFVTGTSQTPQRNELRLVNWQGENEWTVVSDLPPGTPPIGGIEKVPPQNLDHRMFDPVWDAEGEAIYVPAFVLYQALTDFSIWERADPVDGGSEFLRELPGIGTAVASPDRQAVVLTTPTARGDTGLLALAIGAEADDEQYAWAQTDEVASHQAPTWSPNGDALAAFRCTIGGEPPTCDLILLQAGQGEPVVLIPEVLDADSYDPAAGLYLAWRP